jgi:hypothetical protein
MILQIRVHGIMAIAIAAITLVAAGCGYDDENPQAARIVAQAYLNAYTARDSATICRVVDPELVLVFANLGGGSCENYIRSTFTSHEPAVRLGIVKWYLNRARVYVVGEPTRFVGLVKYGSLWHVVEGLAPPIGVPRLVSSPGHH